MSLRLALLALPLLLVAGQPGAAVAAAQPPTNGVSSWTGKPGARWGDYDRLVNEQKLEAASKIAEDVVARAREAGDAEEWTRGLIRWVQLRTALHGAETAVRFLREQPWPEDPLGRTTLRLFYGQSLVHYAALYSWEIRQRERVESKGAVDLKAWTLDQIHAEARSTYLEAWAERKRLGAYPNTALREYVSPNGYPQGIRPTLRDAVTYLTVELLADTSGWRPEELNEVFRLDLPALLGDLPADEATDAAAHPLRRVAALLSDLERWHAGRGELEAALEARLERLRLLRASFSQAPDRLRLRQDLEARLPAYRKLPWWAAGAYLRADLIREETTPDRLVRARAVAEEGAKAFPGSWGGGQCRSLAASIEAPAFDLEGMASDGLGRPSLGVRHRNLSRLRFRAYPYDIERRLTTADDYSFLPHDRELQPLLESPPAFEWTVELPPTPDFLDHQTLVTPAADRPGFYLVVASDPEGGALRAIFQVFGDLVLLTRQLPGEIEVTAVSGATGKPWPGAQVTLYRFDWRNKHRAAVREKADAQGIVRLAYRSDGHQYLLLGRAGGQLALGLDSVTFAPKREPGRVRAALVYTDRSIYRPGQKILWKAVAYRGQPDPGRLETEPGASLTVELRDANHQVVESKAVAANAFGTASGEFSIPAGRLLGQWQVQVAGRGSTAVRVEEYKRPTFEARLLEPESALRLNAPAALRGEARYYFGLPVAGGGVRWRVTRQPLYPSWWGWWGWSAPAAEAQTVAAGETRLDPDGRFAVAFTPRADERLAASPGVTYRYEVSADVTDEGGETRSAVRSFRLGFVAVEAAISRDLAFVTAGEGARVTVARTDLDGAPAPGTGAWRLLRLRGPMEALLPGDQPLPEPPEKPFAATPDDRRRPRWRHEYQPWQALRLWADGEEIARGEARHGADGQAAVEVAALPAGAYRFRYETLDAFGGRFEVFQDLLVADGRSRPALPLVLAAQRGTLRVGETARVLVASGLRDQDLVLERFRGGERVDRRVLRSGLDATVVEIPVTEADRGGISLMLTAVRDHQVVTLTDSVHVPWSDKELTVSFSTFRDRLRPGQRETWTAKVTGPAGRDAAVAGAEVLAYLYDRSLDAFAPHAPPAIAGLYPSRLGWAPLTATLGQARHALSWGYGQAHPYGTPAPDQLLFPSGYGIGGPGRRGYFGFNGRGPMPMLAAKMAEGDAMPAAAPAPADARAEGLADVAGRQAAAKPPAPAAAVELRSDFSETAFWKPHLLTAADGSVSFEFEVPDSVTSWSAWVHAVTRDLKGGSVNREAKTVKELMVRPYLPRFLREGDRAELKVVVNNASDRTLSGELAFDVLDPVTNESLLGRFGLAAAKARRPFTVEAGKGTSLAFAITAPPSRGTVAFKVVAASGGVSDGELRPLPVLPGRLHLAQSRFAVLKDAARRELTFADLAKDDDPTRTSEQLVVTLDAQLFYSVLSALPYLVDYPYECVEQTLNRFLSTGILTSLYRDYPAVERMAVEFSKRKTRLETWDAPDPNRKMALEESPWVRQAKGGEEEPDDLLNVLDPEIAQANRRSALAQLQKAQTSSGGFPWFPGGPPSPYMTLYVVYGFSKGLEFQVDAPRDAVQRAWGYLHRYYVDELWREAVAEDCCWETVTFLNFVLGNYPDLSWTGGLFTEEDRRQMLAFSFRHWKRHSPYLKGLLALTLKRLGRPDDARLVWQSVMDSAKTADDQGTYWAPEDRSWLWYNDTIETHAFALRADLELDPEDPKLDGLVLWLLLNKKLNHWKSTRATAEVVYSLARYLKETKQLGAREEATVRVGHKTTTFAFEPDRYTGKKNQIVVPGGQVDKSTSTVVVEKQTPGYLFASATWHFATDRLPEEERGDFLRVSRTYFKRVGTGQDVTLTPLAEGAALSVGDQVEVHLSLRSKHALEYVHLRDPRGAGFEPESVTSRYKWDLGIGWYEEVRDSGTNFFFEALPQGEYTFKYRLRAATAGTFRVGPATVQPLYAPEFAAYSAGAMLRVAGEGRP